MTAALLFLAAFAAQATPPDIVLIVSDDQGWTDYGFMGHPEIRTPHLDRLAAEGALFTRGYVPGSLCRCSLATLITGLYPHQHGITANDPPPGAERHAMLHLIQERQTLPARLKALGYRSLQTGKWWEGNYRLGGFTDGMSHGDPARGGRHGDEGLAIGREGLHRIELFLSEAEGQPIFLWYAPMLPHQPHNPPERLLETYRAEGRSEHIAKYWAMCAWFDETVGELRALLEAKGRARNTLIVFTADNGWIQDPERPAFDSRSKRSPYDGGLRTPLILHWPDRIRPMRDDATPVITLDLVPTMLAACGLPPAAELPGLNLLPHCADTPLTRDTLYGEVFGHDAVDLTRPASSLLYRWCLRGDWKLIAPTPLAGGAPELYQITQDPHETKNAADAHPDRVAEMLALLDAWWDGQ